MAEYNRLKRRNKIIGLCWLIPLAMLPFILAVYKVASFVGAQTATAQMSGLAPTNSVAAWLSILRVVLGFAGIVAVVGIIVGIPVGIIYLAKHVFVPGTKFDERSGKGEASVVPEEIKGWNWGAVGLNWIWGVSHGVWISLICLIPLVGFIFQFVLGADGNEWAWKNEKWESVEAFKRSQAKWKVWGIVFFVLSMLIMLGQLGYIGR